MPDSARAQATLLLTLSLPGDSASPHVLNTSEWSRLSRWLHAHGQAPEALLAVRGEELLADWDDAKIPRERIRRLLDRRFALAVAAERWESTGIWFVTRGESDYPPLLRSRLRDKAPPFLCGVGDRLLLSRPLVAIVGSRDASTESLAHARALARAVAQSGAGVVSGAAKGIDREAMLAAIDAGGVAVGVLADELQKASRSKLWRGPLIEGQLVLVSQFGVERKFSVGHAMARNKIIYSLSQSAAVIATSTGRGGTWGGAKENLQHGWVKLYLHVGATIDLGVAELKSAGATLYDDPREVLLPQHDAEELNTEADMSPSLRSEAAPVATTAADPLPEGAGTTVAVESYEAFVDQLEVLLKAAPRNAKSIAAALGLPKRRTDQWIQRARDAGVIAKRGRDKVYHLVASEEPQRDLFGSNAPIRESSE